MSSRRVVIVVWLMCALYPMRIVADAATELVEARNEVSLNVFQTAYWAIEGAIPFIFGYQRVLTDHLAISVLPVLAFWGPNAGSYQEFQQWVEVDWHPFDTGLRGFFLGLAAVGVVETILPDGSRGATWFLGLAPAIGYQFLLPHNWDLDLVVAVPLGVELFDSPGGGGSMRFTSDHRRAEIGLGYRF